MNLVLSQIPINYIFHTDDDNGLLIDNNGGMWPYWFSKVQKNEKITCPVNTFIDSLKSANVVKMVDELNVKKEVMKILLFIMTMQSLIKLQQT